MIEWQTRDRSPGRPPVDIAALNPSEREVLGLLAEGHTAKSIATLTGRSVAAVNERLREARRKTGIGSSRELARLYAAAHKNRDEKIDLAAAPAAAPGLLSPARGGWRKGRIVMPLILIGGLAAALIAAQANHGAANAPRIPPDPEILNALAEADSRLQSADLHELVRRERPDDSWARDVEPVVEAGYSSIPHMNDTGPVRVTCAATLCEVAQILPGPDQASRTDRATLERALQGQDLQSDMAKVGLVNLTSDFRSEGAKTLFVAYWSRGQQQPKPDALLDGKLNDRDRGDRRFYRQVRDEIRDHAWADRTERGLNAILHRLPALGPGDHRIRVHCAATLCEVSAATPPQSPRSQIETLYSDLQTTAYAAATRKLGLRDVLIEFGTLPSDRTRGLYVAYYRRDGA